MVRSPSDSNFRVPTTPQSCAAEYIEKQGASARGHLSGLAGREGPPCERHLESDYALSSRTSTSGAAAIGRKRRVFTC